MIARAGTPLPPWLQTTSWAMPCAGELLDPPRMRFVAEVGEDDDVGDLADPPERFERAGDQRLAVHLAAEKSVEQRPDRSSRPFRRSPRRSARRRNRRLSKAKRMPCASSSQSAKWRDHVEQHFVAIGDQQRAGSSHSSSARARPARRLRPDRLRRTATRSGSWASRKRERRRQQAPIPEPARESQSSGGPIPVSARNRSRAPFVGQRRGERGEGERLASFGVGSSSLISRRASRELGKGLAKILIVEDNALNIKLFCDLLAAHGHEPEAVTDSRNALDAARTFKPDLVITDIQLPHVSGLELIELIRKPTRSLRRCRSWR
jgi:hypothetical protein